MKIHYRETEGGVEIVRCFGSDPDVELPGQIGGKPVIRAAAYAFSARKDREEEDVLVFETEDAELFRGEEHLLAGENVESVDFPDSMEEIGRYIFYGCRNLRELKFSGRLMEIGSGAFTGCRSLSRLSVRLDGGRRSCVPEILGDLWQRIDVTFQGEDGEARLVFPEHYEEAVENTPARILFTQHHGSGNNYRQCFYNKEMDWRKYDSLFYLAKAQDKVNVLSDLVFARLLYPVDLTREARCGYETWIREHAAQIAAYLTDTEDLDKLKEISARGLWSRESLSETVEYAARAGKGEVLSLLMDERQRAFPGKEKKYEL